MQNNCKTDRIKRILSLIISTVVFCAAMLTMASCNLLNVNTDTNVSEESGELSDDDTHTDGASDTESLSDGESDESIFEGSLGESDIWEDLESDGDAGSETETETESETGANKDEGQTYGLVFTKVGDNYSVSIDKNIYVEEIVIPSRYNGGDVTQISEYGFTFRESYSDETVSDMLKKVTIPDSVTTIGSYAFAGCVGLTEVNFGSGLVTLREGAFADCSSLLSIRLPDSFMYLGPKSFIGCGELREIEIGKGLFSVGQDAFGGCDKLKTFTTPSVALSSISDMGIETLTVTCGEIKDNVFYNNLTLKELTICNDVTKVGYQAFRACINLEKLTVEKQVWNVNNNAFSLCDKISYADVNVQVLMGMPKSSLVTLRVNGGDTLGNSILSGCSNLTSVTLAKSVKTICENAFSGCYYLSEIVYEGSREDWLAVKKQSGWSNGISGFKVVCTEE